MSGPREVLQEARKSLRKSRIPSIMSIALNNNPPAGQYQPTSGTEDTFLHLTFDFPLIDWGRRYRGVQTARMLSAVWSGLSHLPQLARYGLVQSLSWSPSVAHYYSSAALLFLGTYALTIWWLQGRNAFCLTRCGRVRVVLLVGLAVTGLALIVHNMMAVSQ